MKVEEFNHKEMCASKVVYMSEKSSLLIWLPRGNLNIHLKLDIYILNRCFLSFNFLKEE